ncbi:MAG TPA: DUF3892 domain-containing protein [Acidobacteriaceae bacterium]|nr:DUF3892 domain-containing protein [Acidobacteriaceae bacterium]
MVDRPLCGGHLFSGDLDDYVTAVRMSAGSSHQHIAAVRWLNPNSGIAGTNDTASVIEWLGKPGAVATVAGEEGPATVGVVKASPPYLRTYADGEWTDNLLALPRF